MDMIYAESERLVLRGLEKSDLPCIVELLGEWDVVRWLTSVPFPYRLHNAEEFFERIIADRRHTPEYFLLQRKSDNRQVGAIGLHAPREAFPQPGELVVGYWLGKEFWRQGLMSEALPAAIALAFERAEVSELTATTDPANGVSQKLLKKAGFTFIGLANRDRAALRGSSEVMRWRLTREDYGRKVDFP